MIEDDDFLEESDDADDDNGIVYRCGL